MALKNWTIWRRPDEFPPFKIWTCLVLKSPLYYPIYLFQNPEFHQTVEELTTWLESTTDSIRSSEPVDLRVDRQILEQKLSKFKELYSDLLRCEPRIVSLQEAADQLELQYDGDVEDEEVDHFKAQLSDYRL